MQKFFEQTQTLGVYAMKKMTKSLVAASVLAATTMTSGTAMAGLSGNIGMVSDYYFRGVDQGVGATASAGLDYDISGVYVGTWVADLDDQGAEYDLYAGYAGEFSGFSYDVGYFTYNYTNEAFDNTYKEVALSVGYGPISASYAKGTYDVDPEQDYTFASVTAEYEGFSATYGSWGDDFDGSYVEVGYSTMIADWDAGVSIISNDKDLAGATNVVDENGDATGDVSVIFSVGKSFDF
jgi:uncharacterized protein (TIGR02001 family)